MTQDKDKAKWTPCEPSTDGTLQPTMLGTSPMSAMVYIDALEDGEARGMFRDVFDRFSREFTCLAQFLLELDQAMDDIRSPRPSCAGGPGRTRRAGSRSRLAPGSGPGPRSVSWAFPRYGSSTDAGAGWPP